MRAHAVSGSLVGMKTCYRCKCTKPKEEFRPKPKSSDGLRSECRECGKALDSEYYHKNKVRLQEAARQRAAEWRKKPGNAERNRQMALSWYHEHPKNAARAKHRVREWVAANPEWKKTSDRDWRAANRGLANAYGSAYKARRLKATPSWADADLISSIYALASVYSDAFDRVYHVDHIIPLKSDLVCGLHVQDNLQILPGVENLRKGNREWPGHPAR